MKPLRIAILWHMHQPDYRDPVAGRTLLPWTWLHAVKDYGEMLKTAAEFPAARMTFNLVPTLVEQLDRYADGSARDHWLELAAADPAGLEQADRELLVTQFFSVHTERHILPFPRYRLLARRKEEFTRGEAPPFSDQELRDLQVWFLLAWSGHHLGRHELLRALRGKGENFSEADKRALIDLYQQEVAGIIDRYRQMEQSGQIEVSVTPYAHPILPLLCGTPIAREATPGIALPRTEYRHPEDAVLQVRHGLRLVARRLGEKPRGMWPAEGAVSEEALAILKTEGAQWAASDEGILAKSLPGGLRQRSDLYRPYSFNGLPLIFRDRELSDRIGFVYAHWQPQRAADDLLGHLQRAASAAPGGLLSLILDGENCWERYQENGYPFLAALYQGILDDPNLRMVTVSEALAETKPVPLPKLAPGSWINSDFCIWIGHPEENTAWDLLEDARRDNLPQLQQALTTARAGNDPDETLLHLLRAEGSDWFWWYGDDHVTAQADLFDRLFRRHLEELYRECGTPVPDSLGVPIKPPSKPLAVREPSACFTPLIDGRISDYFEWIAAGSADLSAGGAMHAGHNEFSLLRWGYDAEYLYLLLDPDEELASLTGPEGGLELRLQAEHAWVARFSSGSRELTLRRSDRDRISARGPAAAGRVVELGIPLRPLKLSPGGKLLLSIHLLRASGELARWPAEHPLELVYRGATLDLEHWYL